MSWAISAARSRSAGSASASRASSPRSWTRRGKCCGLSSSISGSLPLTSSLDQASSAFSSIGSSRKPASPVRSGCSMALSRSAQRRGSREVKKTLRGQRAKRAVLAAAVSWPRASAIHSPSDTTISRWPYGGWDSASSGWPGSSAGASSLTTRGSPPRTTMRRRSASMPARTSRWAQCTARSSSVSASTSSRYDGISRASRKRSVGMPRLRKVASTVRRTCTCGRRSSRLSSEGGPRKWRNRRPLVSSRNRSTVRSARVWLVQPCSLTWWPALRERPPPSRRGGISKASRSRNGSPSSSHTHCGRTSIW